MFKEGDTILIFLITSFREQNGNEFLLENKWHKSLYHLLEIEKYKDGKN